MHVMVAIPAYTGTIHLGTMRSLFTDLLSLQDRGDSWEIHDECGNALIADARAVIVDMVAGIYPQRKDPINYCVKWMDKPELQAVDGLLEVDGVPAGFMKLSRKQLESMVAQYPDTEFYVPSAPNEKCWALFADYRIGKHKMGEDYAFCRRWQDMGGQIWIDPEIKMGHIGNKTFNGHLGDWLRNRKG